MMRRLLVLSGLLLLVFGCHKASNAPDNSTAQSAGSNTDASVPGMSPPVVSPEVTGPLMTATNATGDPDYAVMNRDVRRWLLRNRRAPKSFAEYAASATILIPTPPPGKKYALDKHLHVILVAQ